MRALDRKLLRDLWQIKGQGLAIALVIGAGLAMFIAYLSNFDSLRRTQEAYYEHQRFGDVFARLKRAPRSLEPRLALLPGVAQADARVVVDVTLDLPQYDEPITGRLISMPVPRRPVLNDVYLRQGRFLDPGRSDEILLSEGFAEAHGLGPGDRLAAVINGRRRNLEIAGIALSPEYVYSVPPGELIPDDARFAIMWMERRALAAAYDMEGGFNDVSLRLSPGASADEAIARLDRLLEPYGGLGAYPRALQFSHWTLDMELTGLQTVGLILPVIFLAVAAFLLNVVLTRIVTVQREQIAALKALGYADREIGWHYVQWALLIALAGSAVGLAGGVWIGRGMSAIYNDFYRFPVLEYHLAPELVLGALVISQLGAVLGAQSAVRRAVSLPPAEAMRPEPPARYRPSVVERLGLQRWLTQPARMVLRNVERQPGRALASVVGIAFAAAMMVVGLFFVDAIDELLDVQFNVVQRQDVTVTFAEPRSARAFDELARLPGVLQLEPLRAVPARLRFGHRSRQVTVTGLRSRPQLNRVVDASLKPRRLPAEGLVISAKLARLLAIEVGDVVSLEVLEGARPVRRAVVSELVDEYMGLSVYMEIGALRRLMREGGTLSGAYLEIDEAAGGELYRRLKAAPAVVGVGIASATLQSFRDTLAQNILLMVFFNLLFAGTIACGVVYNAARVALSERSRELASLRVMGFTRGEISAILLGELAALTLLAIPLGLVMGYGLAALTTMAYDTELYRFPLVVSPRTYAAAALTVIGASVASGMIVRRKLDHLDLVAVLKTHE